MADYRAVAAVCEAIAEFLKRASPGIELLNSDSPGIEIKHQLQFEVYTVNDFAGPMNAGVSVFPYRLYQNGTYRIPVSPALAGNTGVQTQLPIDVHFLLTAWGQKASLQNTLAGWMMRALEDLPILPTALLNYKWPAFRDDEAVELSPAQLSTEDLFRIWDTLIQDKYQLSVPYVARNIRIDSTWPVAAGAPVTEREFVYEAADP